jgi:hypothetical protein
MHETPSRDRGDGRVTGPTDLLVNLHSPDLVISRRLNSKFPIGPEPSRRGGQI